MNPWELFRTMLILASLIAGLTAGTMIQPGPASAAMASPASHTKLWWDSDTCRAFYAWLHKPTARRLASLDRDRRHADPYLYADAGMLVRTVHRHRNPRVEVSYILIDCTTTGDQ